MYYRLHEAFNRPIASAPDAEMDVLERSGFVLGGGNGKEVVGLTGAKRRVLNLGSYNYLGFAAHDEYCTGRVLDTLRQQGWSTCSSRSEAGTLPLHQELDDMVAGFVRKEAALVFGMGFATNSLVMPALVGPGCLVISDALNHASIVAGCRGSGAKVKVFKHNSAESLEAVLRKNIAEGQPRSGRAWRKILVITEGIFSMEGEVSELAALVAVCKKYRAYVFLDEAHSIGAMGKSGRGICEWANVDPADIDVMMGTFTKSFGSAGGYIAGSRELIEHLKRAAPGHLCATSMSPPLAQQVMSAMRVITGDDGSDRGARKLQQLRDNANFVRRALVDMGCNVLGSYDSPVMPLMLFQPGKIAAFSRLCFERGIAVVVVGFPATPLLTARARLCMSAAHTREQLEWAVRVIDELADVVGLRFYPRRLHSTDSKKALLVSA